MKQKNAPPPEWMGARKLQGFVGDDFLNDGFFDDNLAEIGKKLVYAHEAREEIFRLLKDENGNWVAATGTITAENAITVTADGIATVTGVRMGYRNRPILNLYNTIDGVRGYCASPFMWIS